ncbi:MAG: glycosyltransferase family 39 protein [Anaerolineae bacterium]
MIRITFAKRKETIILWTALLVVILVGFILRVYHLDFQSFWRDEIDSVTFAARDVRAILAALRASSENGPFYFLLLHYWVVITGSGEFALRYFSLLWGVLTLPLTYVLSQRLLRWGGATPFTGRAIGLLAALISAVSPYYIWYSQEAKMYTMLTFLTKLSFYLFLRAIEENRARLWAAYTLVTSLCFHTHVLAVLILVAQDIWFVVHWRRHRPVWKGWGITQASLTLPYLPLVTWQLQRIASPPPPRYPFFTLPDMFRVLLMRFSLSITASYSLLPLSLFVFLLLLGVFLFKSEDQSAGQEGGLPPLPIALRRFVTARRANVLLLFYLLVPIMALYLISLRHPLFLHRYLITIAPAYYVLLACGLFELWRRVPLLSLLAVAVLLWLCVSAVLSQNLFKPDYRGAARYYEEHAQPNDILVFVAPFQRPYFQHYYRRDFPWVDLPKTDNGAISQEELGDAIEALLPLENRVWLFLSEEHYWDSRGWIRAWFEENARLVEGQSFPWIELRCYIIGKAEDG